MTPMFPTRWAATAVSALLLATATTAVSSASPAPTAPAAPRAAAAPAEAWSGQGASLTSTQRLDGTYANPVTGTDTPDVATIRVSAADAGEDRDVFYMISTTMELAPGAPVLKSYDLVNWEIASYLWGVLETNDSSALRNGQTAYGQGQWASTLAFHDGRYYAIFNSNNNGRSYLYSTDDIEDGEWTRHVYAAADRFHDPSLWFEGDTPYVFYGANKTDVAELSADLTTVVRRFPDVITKENFINNTGLTTQEFSPNGWEGFQLYKVGDWYYAMAIAFGKYGRQALVFRSKSLLGAAAATPDPYEGQVAIGTKAIAQGGFVATRAGIRPDQAMVFADDFPTGRVPVLVPVTWGAGADAWPTFGSAPVGNPDQVAYPGTLPMPVTLDPRGQRLAMSKSLVTSDDFDNDADQRRWTYPPAQEVQVPPSTGELLTNGAMEGTTGWTAQGPVTVGLGYSTRQAGATSLKIDPRTAHTHGASQAVRGLVPGTPVQASAWIHYRDGGDASTPFAVVLTDGAGQRVVMAEGAVAKGSTADTRLFTRISGTATVPATGFDVATARVSIETTGAGAVPDIIFVDDVSVIGARAVPDYWTPAEDADNGSYLDKQWQWNHNPDNRYWSLTDRAGWLRLENGRTVTGTTSSRWPLTKFEEARNTLSQRVVAPSSSAETKLDVSGMKDGDTAGLAVYNRQMSFIAARMVGGVKTLGIVNRGSATGPVVDGETFIAQTALPAGATNVWMKADFNIRRSGAGRNTVQFLYSLDGTTWTPLGNPVPKLAGFEGSHFKGQRFGLFNYAETSTGGFVDVDYFALSDVLTSDGKVVDRSDLDWLVAEAAGLDPADYTAEQWAPVAAALADARAVTAPSTQNQVDAPAQALNAAVAALPEVEPGVDPTPEVPPTTPVPTTPVPTTPVPTTPTPTTPVPAPAAKAVSRVKVTVSRAVRRGAVARVKVRVASAGAATGRVTIKVAGLGKPVTVTVRKGKASATLRIPRSARLGATKVKVAYAGDATTLASRSTRTMRVVR